MIIEEADIYCCGKSSYMFVHNFFFIKKKNYTYNRTLKQNLYNIRIYDQWNTSVQAMTPLHGGAGNRLKSMTDPHWFPDNYARTNFCVWYLYELYSVLR